MRFFESIGFGYPESVIANPISGRTLAGLTLKFQLPPGTPVTPATFQAALFMGLTSSGAT